VLRGIEIDLPRLPARLPVAGRKLNRQMAKRDAGEIASAAFSPVLGKVAALAYVRTQFAEPGTELQLPTPTGARERSGVGDLSADLRIPAGVFQRKDESFARHIGRLVSAAEKLPLVGIKHCAVGGLPGRELGGHQRNRRGGPPPLLIG